MRGRSAIVPLSLLSLLWVVGVEPPRARPQPRPPAVEAKLSRTPQPSDAPFAAWSYQRSKRLGGARGTHSPALYRRAERRLDRMPRRPIGKRDGANTWRALGPGNVGGRTRVLVIDPERPRTMYAAGVSGGVWKTTNGGARWRPVGDELTNLAVNSLAMDPADPSVLYAGTGEGYFREVVRETSLPLRGGGIFRSDNGGRSWRRLSGARGKKFHWVNDLVVSRHDSLRIYAATRSGVFRTEDGGRQWKRVLKPKKTRGGCLDLAVREGAATDDLFAACGTLNRGAVYRQPEAEGRSRWTRVLAEEGQGRTSIAIAPSNPEVVYALASSTVPGPGGNFLQALHAVYRSDEGGSAGSWTATVRNDDPRKINTLLLSNPVIAFLEECGFEGANDYFSMGWYVNVIAVDPTDPERVWAGGVDLFRSDDGGRNWNPASWWWAGGGPNFVHADHHGLVFHPDDPDTLFSLNDGGIYRSTRARAGLSTDDLAVCGFGGPGVGWRPLNNNYGVTQFYHGAVFADGETYMAGAQDNGTQLGSEDQGVNGWRRLFGGDGGYSVADPESDRTLYVTIQNGRIFKSTDGGLTFDERTNGIVDLATNGADDFRAVGDNFLFISPLVMDPADRFRLWSGGVRLWRTDNGANSWTAASTRLAGRVSAIAISPSDPDVVLAGTEEGSVHRQAAATSAGEGSEWESRRPREGYVSSLTFDPAEPTTVYATYAGFGGEHVWRSRDGGVGWEAIDGSGNAAVPNLPVHALVVDPVDRDRLFLGTDLGILASTDGGATWSADEGFPRVVTESLSIAETTNGQRFLYAFTHGRGAWRIGLD